MATTPPKKYSVELPNTRKPGQTGIYRNVLYSDNLLTSFSPNVKTLYETFQNALKMSRTRNCIGHRYFDKKTQQYENYVWQTYEQVADRITKFGSGLLYLSDTVVKNPKTEQWAVGIYSNNRPEWFITDQANIAYNLRTVALYDTLGPDAVQYVINHAEIPIAVIAGNRIPGVLQIASKIPGLKIIISMDELDDNTSLPITSVTPANVLKAWAEEKGIKLYTFTEVEKLGSEHTYPHNPPKPEDIACICYTSGTTDVPKGALLTHANFVGAIAGSLAAWNSDENDVLISYLPLAHIMGRLVELCVVARGSSIGYFRGDMLGLIEDIAVLRPTLFPSVPRLLTRIYAKLAQSTIEAPGIKGTLARRAVAAKLQKLQDGQGYTHALWDAIIFNKVKKVLGGRVRFVLTGSAPIAPEVLQFLRIAFVCDIAEGYGQTESVAGGVVTLEGENLAGHVGGPVPSIEVKLVDVPEMNYLSTDKPYPRGELCIRGTNCFVGYYKDEEKTKDTIDEEKWMHSGDIAYVDDRGAFTIVDRKKNIFKLSQGEYVAPEKANIIASKISIENVYLNSPYVLQIFVHGDSLRNYLIAIVVPDPETFVPWANQITGETVSLGDADGLNKLVNNPRVRKAFLAEMDRAGKQGKLRGLKLKRHQAKQYFREELDKLYAESESDIKNNEKAKL
ncbi:5211_t:CDS:10 [Ambispora leptoticha]|uniref:5211_t:CDS:1 n=1 Tax=Ambispora leptoticha TaxID=144679 RepID=A0A9N9C8L1_9GLOM|nr:5211_t:CDS:10 [Ambispora leptoticha]